MVGVQGDRRRGEEEPPTQGVLKQGEQVPTIEPFNFYGQTPWQMNFTYTVSPGNTVEFIVQIPEPPDPDTAALLSFIAAVDADPAWEFTSGSVAKRGGSAITP
jgi:hypothetical protein